MDSLNAIYGSQVHMPLTCWRRSPHLKGRCILRLPFIFWFIFPLFFFFCLAKKEWFKKRWVRIIESPDWKWSKILKYHSVIIVIYIMNHVWTDVLFGILICLLVICRVFRWFHIPFCKGMIDLGKTGSTFLHSKNMLELSSGSLLR